MLTGKLGGKNWHGFIAVRSWPGDSLSKFPVCIGSSRRIYSSSLCSFPLVRFQRGKLGSDCLGFPCSVSCFHLQSFPNCWNLLWRASVPSSGECNQVFPCFSHYVILKTWASHPICLLLFSGQFFVVLLSPWGNSVINLHNRVFPVLFWYSVMSNKISLLTAVRFKSCHGTWFGIY